MEISSKGIKVTFENGEIVDITAEKGDQVMKDLVFKNKERVPWVSVPSYQIQVQFPNQVLPSLIPFLMKMLLTTWLSVQPMQRALLAELR